MVFMVQTFRHSNVYYSGDFLYTQVYYRPLKIKKQLLLNLSEA